MAIAADVVRARIDPALKREASDVLASLGLSISDVIRLVLTRVVAERALPFAVRMPNAETAAAIHEARAGKVTVYENVDDLMHALRSDDGD